MQRPALKQLQLKRSAVRKLAGPEDLKAERFEDNYNIKSA